jgi:hypothetical protein
MLKSKTSTKASGVRCCLVLASGLACLHLSGCASMAEGFARGLMEGKEEDTRACRVVGPAFNGIRQLLVTEAEAEPSSKTVKLIMVHGIGPNLPGYSARFIEKLAGKLKLDVRSKRYKEIALSQPKIFEDETLGKLRLTRYSNKSGTQELLLYELTWSEIFDKYRREIAYDDTGQYTYQRAEFNILLKQFINARATDPVIYLGEPGHKVDAAFRQAFCWAASSNFENFPADGVQYCSGSMPNHLAYLEDDIVFVSHSLGSRIVLDALNKLANADNPAITGDRATRKYEYVFDTSIAEVSERTSVMHEKEYLFFMLSNQIPLLQLGQPYPAIINQNDKYCTEPGLLAGKRLFKNLHIIAFSDPNDLLTYGIPPDFVDEYVDSRLCPTLVNITINVAEVSDVPVLGEVASPMTAHTEYDNDDRIISLITSGIGHREVDLLARERCEWLEIR